MPTPTRLLRCEPLEDRLTPAAGDLDPTFGDGGKALVPFDLGGLNQDAGSDMAVLPDGGIVLAGSAFNSTIAADQNFAVAKLTRDGALDSSFGTGGKVTVRFDPVGESTGQAATAVAVQPDGKVVVAGVAPGTQIGVVRLNPDGSLDPTFDGDGKVSVAFDGRFASASAVAVQSDGRIVLAGSVSDLSFQPVPNADMAVVRLNPDGSLDAGFGAGGRATVAFDIGERDKSDGASDVLIQPDGKIVLVGSAEVLGSPLPPFGQNPGHDFAAARLNPDGSLDPEFGGDGKVTVSFDREGNLDDFASAAFLQPDGRIVLAGFSGNNYDVRGFFPPRGAFAVARVNPDGSPDTSFGVGGKVLISFDPAGADRYDVASAVVVQLNGKVLAGGLVASSGRGSSDFGVIRLNPDGTLDAGFGVGGKVVIPFDGDGAASAIALQPPGKILVAGTAGTVGTPTGEDMAVARLEGDLAGPGAVMVGGRPDGSAVVFSPTDGVYAATDTFTIFPGSAVTVRTAMADVTGDGVSDYVGGAGPGGGPRVVILDGKTGAERASFFAFEPGFTGGVSVAAADLDGDGKAEVVVTPDQGGGPVVAVFDGTGAERTRFFGIEDSNFRGGARAALGDVNADGTPDLVVSAGFGGGPRVAVFDGKSLPANPTRLVADFFAFEPGLRNGAFVAAGDVTGDGIAEIAFGGGPGGAPRVRLFDGKTLLAAGPFANLDAIPTGQRANFFAGDPALRGGVHPALRDADGDGTADLLTGSGEGEPSRVRVYRSANLLANPAPTPDQDLDPFGGAVLADGVFVG